MQVADGNKTHSSPPAYDLAIVVVHWRVPELLRLCLLSLVRARNRSALKLSIVVVDTDKATNQTKDVVDEFQDIGVLKTGQNSGYAAGCNAGVLSTNSQAVLLLNPDTEVTGGAIDRLWQVLFMSEHIGLVAPRLLNSDGTIQSSGYQFPGIVNTFLDLYPIHYRLINSRVNGRLQSANGGLPYEIDYPLGAAMMIKRSAIEDVGLLTEDYFMYCEEIDFARRLDRNGWTRILVPDAEVVHYGGQSTIQVSDEMYARLWLSRAKYHWRWSSKLQRLVQTFIVRIAFHRKWHRQTATQRRSNELIIEAFRHREVGLN